MIFTSQETEISDPFENQCCKKQQELWTDI